MKLYIVHVRVQAKSAEQAIKKRAEGEIVQVNLDSEIDEKELKGFK